jgi:predicted nucleic acid-binding protein
VTHDRFLLDTAFIQAFLDKHDSYYRQAVAFEPRVRSAREVWVTEAVLIEVANALSGINRIGAAEFISSCYRTPNMRVVTVDTPLLTHALDVYQSRQDKTWSLTDCISFVVMEQQGISQAVTTDRHFTQAGFQALLAEEVS